MSLLNATEVTDLNKKMNPEVKAEWIQRLLSGKYKQAKAYLRRPLSRKTKDGSTEGYCCLGVLCDMYAEKTGKGQWVKVDHTGRPNADGKEWKFMVTRESRYEEGETFPVYEAGIPPYEVLEWAGLNPTNVTSYVQLSIDEKDAKRMSPKGETHPSRIVTLTSLNDSGRTFKTVAGIIKKYL